jgi:sec-independent protein translocase protein TatA
MEGIGIEKILLILLVVLLLFGAKRLPEFGRSLGKGIREFKGSLGGVRDAISEPAATPDRVNEGRPATPQATADEPAKEPRRLIS